MYNGIGLATARGSGTNGYVQQNRALLRNNYQRVDYRREEEANKDASYGFVNKVPNPDIVLHDKKREIEIRCLELEEELEGKKVPEAEIRERVAAMRKKLQQNIDGMTRNVKSLKNHETHLLAKAKNEENVKFATALGIKDHVEGAAFDQELQERKRQERIEMIARREEEELQRAKDADKNRAKALKQAEKQKKADEKASARRAVEREQEERQRREERVRADKEQEFEKQRQRERREKEERDVRERERNTGRAKDRDRSRDRDRDHSRRGRDSSSDESRDRGRGGGRRDSRDRAKFGEERRRSPSPSRSRDRGRVRGKSRDDRKERDPSRSHERGKSRDDQRERDMSRSGGRRASAISPVNRRRKSHNDMDEPSAPDCTVSELRQQWEFAAVVQFILLFHQIFHFTSAPETEWLERELVSPPSPEFIEIQVKMLKVVTRNRFINNDTWLRFLRTELERRGADPELFPYDMDYQHLPTRNKLLILHRLCEWQMDDPDRFRQLVKNADEANHWRVDPVGWDAAGNTYWLFDDNRLYREENGKKPKKGKTKGPASPVRGVIDTSVPGRWTLCCATIEEWSAFPEKFRESRDPTEKRFYKFLLNAALPQVLPDLEDKRREKEEAEARRIAAEERAIAMEQRRRSARNQLKELEQLEIDKVAMFGNGQMNGLEGDSSRLRPRRAAAPTPPPPDPAKDRQERALRRRGGGAAGGEEKYPAVLPERPRKRPPPRGRRGRQSSEEDADEEEDLEEEDCEEEQAPVVSRSVREGTPWLFNCACGVAGENIDDGLPMMQCDRCQVWAHIVCIATAAGENADQVDIEAWSARDYVCKRCLAGEPPYTAQELVGAGKNGNGHIKHHDDEDEEGDEDGGGDRGRDDDEGGSFSGKASEGSDDAMEYDDDGDGE